MRQLTMSTTVVLLTAFALRVLSSAEPMQPAAPQKIDLAERLAAGKLRAVNREVTPAQGKTGAVHLSEKPGNGIAWIEGTDFANGTIQVDVRGRDVFQQSFLGVAFHGKDDKTYEAVYLRPFNFRSDDPARPQHAVQYISLPDFDWPRLRKKFPEEFENPVDASVAPTVGCAGADSNGLTAARARSRVDAIIHSKRGAL